MPLVLAAAVIPFVGYPLLFLPIHVVWLEPIIHPTAILAFQTVEETYEKSRPRPLKNIFDTRDWLFLIVGGSVISLAVCATYIYALGPDSDNTHARAASLATLIASSALFAVGLAGLNNSLALLSLSVATASVLLLTQMPTHSNLTSLSPPHKDDWLITVASAVASFVLSVGFKRRSTQVDLRNSNVHA